MSNLNKILNLSKLQLSILISINMLDKDGEGVTGRQLTTFLKDRVEQDNKGIERALNSLMRNKFLIRDSKPKFKLNGQMCKELILLFDGVNSFIIDRLIHIYIPLSSLRIYIIMRALVFPRVTKPLKISYRKLCESYHNICLVEMEELDMFEVVKVLIDEGIINKKTYDSYNGRYNEYTFVTLEQILKEIGLE